MCRIIDLSLLSNRLRLIVLLYVILSLHGCAVMKSVQEKAPPIPVIRKKISNEMSFRLQKEMMSLADWHSSGLKRGIRCRILQDTSVWELNGISAANPGVDIWVPEAGERIMLPLSFILPDAPRKGIVINLGRNEALSI